MEDMTSMSLEWAMQKMCFGLSIIFLKFYFRSSLYHVSGKRNRNSMFFVLLEDCKYSLNIYLLDCLILS